jgi:hypothetical protein
LSIVAGDHCLGLSGLRLPAGSESNRPWSQLATATVDLPQISADATTIGHINLQIFEQVQAAVRELYPDAEATKALVMIIYSDGHADFIFGDGLPHYLKAAADLMMTKKRGNAARTTDLLVRFLPGDPWSGRAVHLQVDRSGRSDLCPLLLISRRSPPTTRTPRLSVNPS